MTDIDPTAPLTAIGSSTERFPPTPDDAGLGAAKTTSTLSENAELKAEIERLRSERTRWMESQRRLMELLGTSAPEKIAHDLRNLLNERDLLKTLVDAM